MLIILSISGGVIVLFIALYFLSKTEKQRIMTIFRLYKNNKKEGLRDVELIKKTVELYNKDLFTKINDPNIGHIRGKLFINLAKNNLKNLTMMILLYEDVFIMNKTEVSIKKNKEKREANIDKIYIKRSMQKYEDNI